MKRLFKKIKRLNLYKKCLLIFTLLLVILTIFCIVYVYKTMVIYERSLVDNYIEYLADNGTLSKNIDVDFEVSEFEIDNASIQRGINSLLKSDDLIIKKNSSASSGDIYAYDLKMNDNVLMTVYLKNTSSYTRMAILTINEWEIQSIETNLENGLYYYEITIPEDYTLYINGFEVGSEYITESTVADEFARLKEYTSIEGTNTYTINNLIYEPIITIVNEKKEEVEFSYTSNIEISKEYDYVTYDELQETFDFDILSLAENWSLFLTNDLGGTSHGLYKLTPYLISGSYMYEMAYGWATQVDITFVSSHTLKNPVFTNESVSNCIIYNEEAFSCEVYLEKNMTVKGEDRVDTMHDRLYFVYYDNEYKLVDMQSL